MRPPSFQDQINKLEIGKILNQKLHCTTYSIRHSYRSIPVERLDRNLYTTKKWRASRQISSLGISLSCPNPPEDRHSFFAGLSDFDQPNSYLDEVVGGYLPGSRGCPGFTGTPSVVIIPEAHNERFKRVPVCQKTACDQKDLMNAEDEADKNIAWMMGYFK